MASPWRPSVRFFVCGPYLWISFILHTHLLGGGGGVDVPFRWRARPQPARARILNPVSGGQCHLTILRRFSWPNLGYMFTKVA